MNTELNTRGPRRGAIKSKVIDALEFLDGYWIPIFLWMITICALTWSVGNSTVDVRVRIAILSVLTPLALTITLATRKKDTEREEFQSQVNNTNQLLQKLLDTLTDLYPGIPLFFGNVLSPKCLNDSSTRVPFPKLLIDDIGSYLKSKDMILKTDDEEYRQSMLDLQMKLASLTIRYGEFTSSYLEVAEILSKPFLDVIRREVEKESPFHSGPISPQPVEFQKIYYFSACSEEARCATFEAISALINVVSTLEVKTKQTTALIKYHERVQQLDSRHPIKSVMYGFAIEVNYSIEAERMKHIQRMLEVEKTKPSAISVGLTTANIGASELPGHRIESIEE